VRYGRFVIVGLRQTNTALLEERQVLTLTGKSKVNAVLYQVRRHEDVLVSEWSVSRLFTPGEKPPVPIGQEAGWSPQPVWTRWRRKKIPSLPGMEPRSSSP
jgi:hypothetical protein